MKAVSILATCAGLAAGSAALAQPALVGICMGNDLSADGQIAVGAIFEADSAKSYLYSYSRQAGFTRLGARSIDPLISCSDDASVVAYNDYNVENLQNAAGSIVYTGTTNGPLPWNTGVAHCWSAVGGGINIGPAPNGNNCDFNINTAYQVAAGGRYMTISGWTNSACGPFRAWRYDRQTAAWSQLPISISAPPASAPSRAIRGNAISGDGTVICGYDDNWVSAMTHQGRRAAVWVHNGTSWVLTALDPDGGEAFGVSADGNTVVGKTHTGIGARWVRTGGVWGPALPMGGGVDSAVLVNNDGTIIAGGGWIWKPTLNGGVPMSIGAYMNSIGASFPGFSPGTPIPGGTIFGFSNDGSVIGLRGTDARNPCLTVYPLGLLYVNGSPCVPPTVAFSPVSQSQAGPPGNFGTILNTFAAGSWPLNYQWQKETSPGTWTNLSDDNCGTTNAALFDFHGTTNLQLRIGALSGTWNGNYRCVVSNSCGSATTNVAVIAPPAPPCYANCDNSTLPPTLNVQDFGCFLNKFAAGDTYANCDGSTIVPVLNVQDFSCFLNAFATGCS